MKSEVLYYSDIAIGGSSDKEYRIQITKNGSGYHVQFQFGRRGGTLQSGVKTNEPVPLEEAERIFTRLVAEKLSKGYHSTDMKAVAPIQPAANSNNRTEFPGEDLTEISREDAEALVRDERYWMQKKLDGERRQFRRGADMVLRSYNKKGQEVAYPNELTAAFEKLCLPWKTFHIDGELIGNVFWGCDLFMANGVVFAPKPYKVRYRELCEAIVGSSKLLSVVPTFVSTKQKQAALAGYYEDRAEGVVFKLHDAPYKAGHGQHKKLKFVKECTCKILALKVNGHDNATLGLYDGKKWIDVGGASMIGKDKRIVVGSLVEVRFLYATAGRRLFQPRIKELRFDVDESACTFAQLKHAFKEGVAA